MAFAADGAGDARAGLAGLTPVQREQALARWQVLHGHREGGGPLVRVAGENDVPERTLCRWLAACRAGGLAALARGHRSGRGTSAMLAPPPPGRARIISPAPWPPRVTGRPGSGPKSWRRHSGQGFRAIAGERQGNTGRSRLGQDTSRAGREAGHG